MLLLAQDPPLVGATSHFNRQNPILRDILNWWVGIPHISGGIRFYDLGTKHNHGTITGHTWSTSHVPGGLCAVNLPGTGAITLASTISFTTSHSFIALVKMNATGQYAAVLKTGFDDSGWHIYDTGSGNYTLRFYEGTGATEQNATRNFPVSKWTTVGVAGGTCYIEGVGAGAPSNGKTVTPIPEIFSQPSNGNAINGEVASLILFSRTLTAIEMREAHNEAMAGFPTWFERQAPAYNLIRIPTVTAESRHLGYARVLNEMGGGHKGIFGLASSSVVSGYKGAARVLNEMGGGHRGTCRFIVTVNAGHRGEARVVGTVTGAGHRGTARVLFTAIAGHQGRYRVGRATSAGYAVYVGVGGPPDLDAAPDAFSSTLPIEVPVTPPVSGTQDFYVVVRRHNQYGLASTNQHYTILTVDSTGALVRGPVRAPSVMMALPLSGSRIRLGGKYTATPTPAHPPDTWKLYIGATAPDIENDVPVGSYPLATSISRDFTPYAPGTWHTAIALYRSVDDAYSEPIRAEVVLPDLPDTPGNAHTGIEN